MQKYNNNKLFYKQNGFCVVHSFLKPAELKKIDQKVKKFILQKSKKLKGKNINFTKIVSQIPFMILINLKIFSKICNKKKI